MTPTISRVCAVLPTGIETELTLYADDTYHLKQDYVDHKDGHDETNGTFQVLDNKRLDACASFQAVSTPSTR